MRLYEVYVTSCSSTTSSLHHQTIVHALVHMVSHTVLISRTSFSNYNCQIKFKCPQRNDNCSSILLGTPHTALTHPEGTDLEIVVRLEALELQSDLDDCLRVRSFSEPLLLALADAVRSPQGIFKEMQLCKTGGLDIVAAVVFAELPAVGQVLSIVFVVIQGTFDVTRALEPSLLQIRLHSCIVQPVISQVRFVRQAANLVQAQQNQRHEDCRGIHHFRFPATSTTDPDGSEADAPSENFFDWSTSFRDESHSIFYICRFQ